MKTRKMPPALARYWRTHKRPGGKRKRRGSHTVKMLRPSRTSAHVATVHRRHTACSHATARQVISNVRGVLWCPVCGSLCDRRRWHRPRG